MDTNLKLHSNNNGLSLIYRAIDSIIIFSTFYFISIFYTSEFNRDHFLIVTYSILIYLIIAERDDLYRSWRVYRFIDEVFSLSRIWFVTFLTLLIIAFFSKVSADYSRVVAGLWLILTPILLTIWRYFAKQVLKTLSDYGYNQKDAVIIGVTESGIQLANQLKNQPQLGINVIGFYDDREKDRLSLDNLPAPFKGSVAKGLKLSKKGLIQHVYISMPMKASDRIKQYLNMFSDTTANTYLIPDFFVYNLMQSRLSAIGNIPTISIHDTPFYGSSSWLKRAQDIVVASAIILLISPVLIGVAIGVKLSSPGPIIFKQFRYGLDGRRIKVWKFRSMSTMDNGNIVKQATKNDPRITPFGAFIRKTSLDELPQFFNVLQGRMSIVGPRPHAVAHNEEYRTIVERYMLRHKVKPGITGLAQIKGFRGETDTLDKMQKRVEFDLKYIQSWSTWLDVKIIFLTIFKGFSGKTAY
ncbi:MULTISPECIES: undecaprenyl-phosphate glucose phosphotransferase [Aliivibrio]|uniref:Undecaprenyl-phosphate glucose phosphotransferase n=1 Tax=Aliivibrio finisterrensis TaxID=511998 RepID=A0A4Q5KVC5_9GAMM|nr:MULTISPECIES: undecaprenyl-phosphate glucose phosphotransferase [Aliivibrio]MDD9178987.1 undecaprenyl-phosphate glucose phosphotransferase [Aliivibrio sp. A6]RYU50822.1 undecaprenyl-phosphate glucose phosphotransferase [Aliivibrio finisterrensis]RYU53472.1 undecaprenyl-phosphate glucose phosphotransferase [Aliivibrio finisterrensis]RYU58774.1 undecaprenyl-phosphate glucose phosphotransferase [Aliivibrio finisterrensis]RYU64975.1 undecaprenyl-phosphate glucose phosphotransferase [Aliivibrio 